MLKILFWTFILVLIVRFVVKFVLPVFRMARTAQSRIREMQQQMENAQQPQSRPVSHPAQKQGDYIDYEEVK